MTYQGIESKVSSEREAILAFLEKYWDVNVSGEKPLSEAVEDVLQEGVKYGIALQEKDTQKAVEHYNRMANLVNRFKGEKAYLPLEFTRTYTDGEAEFLSRFEKLKASFKEWGISAQPKDYKALKQEHESDAFDDVDEELEFSGTRLHCRIGADCFEFQDALKKGNIYYSEAEQDRPPLGELVGAIFRQGATIGHVAVDQKYGGTSDLHDQASKMVGATRESGSA